MRRGAWVPPVDIFESDQHELVIKAELPDVPREEIRLTVEQQTLTIAGERRMDSGVTDDRWHRVERAHGPFSRTFALPPTVDPDKVRADYRDGVLTIRLPRREETLPRQVAVTIAD